jgi:hypothetical protein
MNFELRTAAATRRALSFLRPFTPLQATLGLALLPVIVPAASTAQDSARQAAAEDARDSVLNGSYQTEMPGPQEPPDLPDFSIPPWLVEALLWLFGALVVAAILYLLFNLLLEALGGRSTFRRNRNRQAAAEGVVETPVTLDRETRDRTLAEADALAADGRFTEAIHLLLLVAMDRLRRELGPKVAPALTSREVLHSAPIPETVVAPLTRMVALSEIKHFGGRAAAAPDYQSCRQDFLHFSSGQPAGA